MPLSRSSRMVSMSVSTTMGARPREGSSNKIIRGALIMARAMASICCSPPERVPAYCFRRCFRIGKRAKFFSRSASMAESCRR